MSFFGMSPTTLKNLFSGPVTENYPFTPKEFLPGSRGKLDIEIDKCIYCGICQRKCPTTALVVTKEPKAWTIDRMRCISCNACVDVCPKKCLALNVKYSACASGKPYQDTFGPKVSGEVPHA